MEGRGTARLLEGAATASAFEVYVEHILFPGLHPEQQLIEDKGWQLLFLPAYSPDCSPSEETFSKVKAFLRRTEARTREALQDAIVQALLTVTSQDAQGRFKHCGYVSLEEGMREKVAQSFCSPRSPQRYRYGQSSHKAIVISFIAHK